MCGIVGRINFDRQHPASAGVCRAMLRTIQHRGPDGDGVHVSGHVGLGHCRLSIIDLETGQQPLSNEDGTVWIVFNGEIYNYKSLRVELQKRGHVFRTQSDTEVIVHLYEDYGESCVDYLRGMFAFAVWDERQQLLFLARDRVGIKPVYYSVTKNAMVFASEIKAIFACPEIEPEITPSMIDRFLTYFYLPGEETLFHNVLKLPAGSCMTVKDGTVRISQYWDLPGGQSEVKLRDAEEQLLALLEEAVALHMISDVPVGFLLSGGVDSTAMLGLAAATTDQVLKSFTLGFDAPGITDERPYARLAAHTYGSQHYEMTITSKEFQCFLPKYVWHMEEPVCEPPAVALYYVSRMAKEHATVLISGEGGDEAFGGYPNYRNLLWLERAKASFGPFRGVLAACLLLASSSLGSKKIAKYQRLIGVPFENYYFSRTSSPFHYFNSNRQALYTRPFDWLVRMEGSSRSMAKYIDQSRGRQLVNRMLYIDTKTWLTDDLLLKADKMTMANSIELRVPLLDHKILEFAASLPASFKVRGATTKYIAKKTLGSRVPKEILYRKKTGFPVPYESWLRTELKEWVHSILLDPDTIERGYFERRCIEDLLARNSESGDYSKEVFSLVTLELLHREFLGASERARVIA